MFDIIADWRYQIVIQSAIQSYFLYPRFLTDHNCWKLLAVFWIFIQKVHSSKNTKKLCNVPHLLFIVSFLQQLSEFLNIKAFRNLKLAIPLLYETAFCLMCAIFQTLIQKAKLIWFRLLIQFLKNYPDLIRYPIIFQTDFFQFR